MVLDHSSHFRVRYLRYIRYLEGHFRGVLGYLGWFRGNKPNMRVVYSCFRVIWRSFKVILGVFEVLRYGT